MPHFAEYLLHNVKPSLVQNLIIKLDVGALEANFYKIQLRLSHAKILRSTFVSFNLLHPSCYGLSSCCMYILTAVRQLVAGMDPKQHD